MKTRVLLVEDDERIRAAMRMALEREGHQVAEAASGEDAMHAFSRGGADVVLVDLMLPGIDGFEVCRRLRRSSDVPIIVVTARADSHDVVAGLEAGADDYLTKPFVPKELSARIRAVLRRSRRESPPSRFTFGEVEVLPEEGVVRRAGEEVHLTKTEFDLLCELAANPGRVLSREDLLERIWDYDYLGDGRLVDVHVRRLRTKIEPDPGNPRHVVTVRRRRRRCARPTSTLGWSRRACGPAPPSRSCWPRWRRRRRMSPCSPTEAAGIPARWRSPAATCPRGCAAGRRRGRRPANDSGWRGRRALPWPFPYPASRRPTTRSSRWPRWTTLSGS
jgi:DNA-binding response OmpR family regulator